MKFLIDENLPCSLVGWLAGHGVPSELVAELGLAGRPDTELATYSAERGSVIMTKDKDFEDLVLRTPGLRVARLAIGNMKTRELLIWFEGKLPAVRSALESPEPLIVL